MSNDNRMFELEERLIDFAVRIIRISEPFPISIFVTSIKTAKQKEDKKTSQFEIPCSIFVIQHTVKLYCHLS